jgi:hypothetical protein
MSMPETISRSVGKSSRSSWAVSQGGDGAVYDLHADAFGRHCQCLGFEQHGHCKRVQTVQAAGRLFNLLAG